MTIMQGQSAVIWDWITIGMSILSALCVWYFVVIGRDRNPSVQKRGETTVEHYGDIQEDRAPVSKFIWYTIIGVGVWSIGYAIVTGFYGLF